LALGSLPVQNLKLALRLNSSCFLDPRSTFFGPPPKTCCPGKISHFDSSEQHQPESLENHPSERVAEAHHSQSLGEFSSSPSPGIIAEVKRKDFFCFLI
jgi:hypothetical protein